MAAVPATMAIFAQTSVRRLTPATAKSAALKYWESGPL
jgi:hypothetical protein